MALPSIDHTDTLSMTESLGMVRQLTRFARVSGLASTDYTVLLEGLRAAGIPDYGSRLIPFTTPPTDPNYRLRMLVLVDRKVKLTDRDPGSVDVTLDYQHILDGDSQSLNGIAFPGVQPTVLYGKNKTSVQQTKTNFFNDYEYAIDDWDPTKIYTTGDLVEYEGLFWYRLVPPSGGQNNGPPTLGITQPVVRWAVATIAQIYASGTVPPYSPSGSLAAPGDLWAYNNQLWIAITGTPLTPQVTPSTVASTNWAALPGPASGNIGRFTNRASITIPNWNANTIYAVGQLVADPTGTVYIRVSAHEGGPAPYQPPVFGALNGTPAQELWRLATNVEQAPFIIPGTTVRRLIVLAHRFGPRDEKFKDQTKFQTGEITVMQPHRNFTVQGYKNTAAPWLIEKGIINKVNNQLWLDGDRWEWMCTEVTWEAIDANNNYKMKLEFQHNPDTWQPTAVFNDQRNGRPPSDMVEGAGYRQIEYHEEIDFNNYFQTQFEGWVAII